MIFDHTHYNFISGKGDPARELSMFFQCRNNSNRLYYTYQSVWVAVGKELPAKVSELTLRIHSRLR